MHNRNRCLHKQFVAEKYDIQCTPTKLVLYNWMNPKANHLRDFDMTTIQLNKSKKLKGRKYSTKRFKKYYTYRNATQTHSYANGIIRKNILQQTNVRNDQLIVLKTNNKQNSMKKVKNSSGLNSSCLTKHNRHVRCFESPFIAYKKNNHVKATNHANQSCLLQRYAIHKNECLFKRLQTMLKQQFNEFILPVLTEHNTKSNKLKDNTETINSQTIESFNEIPHSKQSLNNQSEKISLKFNSSKLCNSNDISDYDRRSQYDYGENFLKQFEEKYTFNDTSNSTESIIYVYCSTCSHIFPCKNLDELKQLNLFESDTFSSTYDFSSENEDIDEEFQLEESHPFYMDYLNPSYEWIRTSRPYSAPPVLISTTYK